MKKIYFSVIISCITVINTFAQNPCQISLTSAVGTDTQTVCVNTAITVITYSVSGTSASISPSLPAGLNGSYSAGVYTLSGTPTASGLFNYTITTTGGCSPTASAVGKITVASNPSSSGGTSTQSVCENSAITPIIYGVSDTSTTSGLPSGVSSVYSKSQGQLVISGTPTVSGTFNYTVTTQGYCGSYISETGTINVGSLPIMTSPNATTICSGSSVNIALTSNIPSSYTWIGANNINTSGESITTQSSSTLNDTITNNTGYSQIVTYTVTPTGGCPGTNQIVNVTVNPSPTATISGSTTVCQNAAQPTITFTGSNGIPPYTITYNINGGTNQTVNTLASTATIPASTSAAGTFTYSLISVEDGSAAACSQAQSGSAIVTIDPLPTASAGGSHTICQNASYTLQNGEASAIGGSQTWTTNGSGSITNGANTLIPTYTPVDGDVGNTVTLLMTVTNTNSCAGATATANYYINVDGVPIASAYTGSHMICENASYTLQNGEASQRYGSPTWTENGTGSITNGVNTLTPTYQPEWGDAGNTVTLLMTVTSTNSCAGATATANYFINVDALPTAGAPNNSTICQNATATISGTSASNGSILWTENGAGTLNNAATLSPTYIAAAGDAGMAVTLTMTVTSTNTCYPALAYATDTVNVDNCSQTPCQISLTSGLYSDGQSGCINSTIGTITYSVSGTSAIVSGLPNGLTSSYNAGILSISGAPTVSGTFNYTVTPSGGCLSDTSAKGSLTILNLPPPTAIIVGSTTVCQNATNPIITFIGADANSEYPLYSFTYNINGVVQPTIYIRKDSAMLAVSTNAVGTYTYNLVYVEDSSGCAQTLADAAIVTIDSCSQTPCQLAVSILSTNETTSTACNGYLEAVTKGGVTPYTYVWSDSAAVNSAYRYKECSGTYSVTVTDHAGCSATAAAYIGTNAVTTTTINPLSITVTSTDATSNALCNGSAVATVTGGAATYSISFAGTTTTGSVLTISNLCAGFYTVNVKDAQNNTASFTFVVGSPATTHTIAPKPVYKDSTVAGTLITNAVTNCIINYNAIDSLKVTSLSLIGTDSINATWTIYQGSTINTQKAKYPFTAPGVYKLILDLFCTNRTSGSAKGIDEVYITNRSTGIADIGATSISVYPNPTTGIIYLQGQAENTQVKICDVLGNSIYQNNGAASNLQIDLSTQPNGVYLMSIQTGGGTVNKKIVVSR